MTRNISDIVAPAAFVASLVTIGMAYGIHAGRSNWFPSQYFFSAEETIRDLAEHWKNDLELEPTRHIVDAWQPRKEPGASAFRMLEPDRTMPGYTLVSGISDRPGEAFHVVMLYDEQGREVHRWPVHYERLDPDGARPANVMLHGMEVFEDGSIVVTFDAGEAISRLDPCGEPIWALKEGFHHSITRDGQGRLWSWRGDDIVALDEATGEELSVLNLPETIVKAGGGQEGVFALHAVTEEAEELVLGVDPYHTNDVEPLRAELAAAFPMFEEGDLLISLREINLVAVVAPEDGQLRWYRHGPWHRQHDPDFQPDGTISVFDNGTGLRRSRILAIDPATSEVTEMFAPREGLPFYTWRRGKHQVLDNGNILITEAERGRIFEVAPDGTLVWEREFPWDESRNLIVTEARHVPADFFAEGAPSCRAAPVDAARIPDRRTAMLDTVERATR